MTTYEEVRFACAGAAHEMNRVYCRAIGDVSQVTWDRAEEWQRQSALNGVDGVFAGDGPGASHKRWLDQKLADGWRYGEVKDAEAKTHPSMLPFHALPCDEQQKDHIFVQTVHTMAAALGYPVPGVVPVIDGLRVGTRPAE
jgi:hypothetical protein